MDRGVRNTLFGIAAFIAVVLGMLVASVMLPKEMTKEQAQQLGYYRFDAPRPIPEFELYNHLGETVGLDSLRGEHSILFFGFTTCPDICPTTLSVLADSVKGVKSPPRVIMISVDPERDTPQKLADYVPAFNPGFVGYTGSFDETVKVATALNIAFGKVPGPEPGSYLVDHSASLVVVNPQGQYAGFIKAPHNLSPNSSSHSAQNLRAIYASLN